MAIDESLADRVRSQLFIRSVAFVEKRMMGGLCFMVNEKMCVGVEGARLMVRLDPTIYEESLRRLGCVPMDFTGKPMRGFVFVQSEGLATSELLKEWIDLALEFNPHAKASRRKSSTKPAMKSNATTRRKTPTEKS